MARKRKYTVPIQLIELENENYHILIEGFLKNGKSLQWVIDTGASKTVFDANLAEHFDPDELEATEIQSAGIGEGHVETQTGILHEIYFGQMSLSDWPVAIINLGHINKIYSQFTDIEIAGLLGSDFLLKHQCIIDFKNLQITLYVS
ncbi:MAG: clan AA aspartic protease [Prolixibacteraceae bacterium]|nr:clan AA aspartic protease [Prolixibacteraceae bacterium]MBN2648492.1 clan AA aspartic protease [Prolixibacteraceae bacterium]